MAGWQRRCSAPRPREIEEKADVERVKERETEIVVERAEMEIKRVKEGWLENLAE